MGATCMVHVVRHTSEQSSGHTRRYNRPVISPVDESVMDRKVTIYGKPYMLSANCRVYYLHSTTYILHTLFNNR